MKISNSILKLMQTEKSNKLNSDNIYTFKVLDSVNKNSVRNEIESIFGVNVVKIWTLIMPNKPKVAFNTQRNKRPERIRVGRFKKAFVKLKDGQSILSEKVKGDN